jgi:hypothetical protein
MRSVSLIEDKRKSGPWLVSTVLGDSRSLLITTSDDTKHLATVHHLYLRTEQEECRRTVIKRVSDLSQLFDYPYSLLPHISLINKVWTSSPG